MKKGTKIGLSIAATLFGVVALASCTQSFCAPTDSARMMYAFEPGITRYEAGTNNIEFKKIDFEDMSEDTSVTIFTLKNVTEHVAEWNFGSKRFEYTDTTLEHREITYLSDLINGLASDGKIVVTDNAYYRQLDRVVFTRIFTYLNACGITEFDFSISEDNKDEYLSKGKGAYDRLISQHSYYKFLDDDTKSQWSNFDRFDAFTRKKIGNPDLCPGSDYINSYKSKFNGYASTYRTCLTTRADKYGSYGYSTDGIYVNAKTWGYAWSKGLFEGLLVYPIGWLIDTVVGGFTSAGMKAGPAALLGIIIVTLIIRSLMLLATFKQTTSSAKMTELQPEIQKIQNKYPNSNTSQVEKQRMAEEMQRLYKKNKINPFTAIIVMIIQFPVFICVWGALSGASSLTSGSVLGLNLSVSIREALFNQANWGPAGNYSAVTALFLFLLMAAAQTISMLLPQWIQKAKAKKVAKLGKNPAQNSQGKQMKIFTYVMLALIIFMGFSLVSAMGIYWFIGAVFSVIQTLITQAITSKKSHKK